MDRSPTRLEPTYSSQEVTRTLSSNCTRAAAVCPPATLDEIKRSLSQREHHSCVKRIIRIRDGRAGSRRESEVDLRLNKQLGTTSQVDPNTPTRSR